MKKARGRLARDPEGGDNLRIKCYVSKYTINPARTSRIAEVVGSVEMGKWVGLVLWDPASFGVKPSLILKDGQIVSAVMGDANASIPTPEPTLMRTMLGGHGAAPTSNSIIFTPQAAIDAGVPQSLGLHRRICPAHGVRRLTKADMAFNDATPALTVDPETYEATVGGEKVTCEPAHVLIMTQRYFLFWTLTPGAFMIIESISGNIHDLPGEELEGVHVRNVVLSLADLTERIQRVYSDHGTELGIRLASDAPDLREGDILLRDECGTVAVCLEPIDILVIVSAAVREMGAAAHNLDNRHLPTQLFGPEEPFSGLEGHDDVMVIQYDHTAEHYLEYLGVRHAQVERSMPVPFRHAEHTH